MTVVNSAQGSDLDESKTKNKTTNVDDTAGFMAAARAWKSRNMSPVYTQAVVKTPEQLSEHSGDAKQTQKPPSPVRKSFEPAKVEKTPASSYNVSPPKSTNVDDTVGFMAAARARNMPSVYTQAAGPKTPDQMSEYKAQTQSSPTKGSFATPTEKAPSGFDNDISGGDGGCGALGSEMSNNTQTYETPHEKMSVASPKKPAIVNKDRTSVV